MTAIVSFHRLVDWVIAMVMMFSATSSSISAISLSSVLLVEEIGVPGKNDRPAASHWQTLSHNVCCTEYIQQWAGFELTTFVVMGTDCTDSCISKYHTITTTTAPLVDWYLMPTLAVFSDIRAWTNCIL